MTKHKHPGITDAKVLAERYKKEMVIVIHVGPAEMGYVSYGQTKASCTRAHRLAEGAYEAIERLIWNDLTSEIEGLKE